VIPAAFEYARPSSLAEALQLLSDGGDDARPIAGGHSLLPLMRLRLARPSLLVDIGDLSDLRYVREEGDQIAIGALCTHHALSGAPELTGGSGLIAQVAAQIGDPQVRHRGTIGGSIAHADPASDLPAALLALDGQVVAQSSGGSRTIEAADFFIGPLMSALEPGEILTELRVARRPGCQSAYEKFQRRAQDWAIVGVAAVIESDGGTISSAALGLTNMAATPVRASGVEEALVGASGEDAIAEAAQRVSELGTPLPDQNASPEFRLHLAEVMIRRAVANAMN